MKRCPVGAIITREELVLAISAAECAVSFFEAIIDSETPRGRTPDDVERERLSVLRYKAHTYRSLLKKMERVRG